MKIQVITLIITFLTLEVISGQSIDQNYVKSTDYKQGLSTTTVGTATSEQKIETIQYYDGLGRPIQSIAISAGGSSEDIITHIGYDSFGRIEKDYLPVSDSLNGLTYNNAIDEDYINNFYDAKYPTEWPGSIQENAYSQKLFEDSPLNRVLKQAAPGEDWKLASGHVIEFDYDANDSNDVKLFTVSLTSDYTPSLTGGASYYTANTLYKNITYDENHTSGVAHSTEEYKDKQGKVILKRTYGNADLNGDGDTTDTGESNAAHDTYYIYDDYGNLTYVLPPKMDASSTVLATLISQLDELGYQYKYDERNRLAEKKIPGKEWEYIIYDNLDRPVLTQDALLRVDDKWLFTKYDVFGRVAYTGIYTHATTLSRSAMQSHLNNNRGTDASFYEEKTSSGDYYTNSDFPSLSCEILTFNYYDNYSFDRAGAATTVTSYGKSSITSPKGLATGSKSKVLDQSPVKWITNVTYYDEYLRPIYNYSNNDYLETTDIIESKLIEDLKPDDIRGLTHETKTTHQKTNQLIDIVTTDKFTYDHMGRLITQKQQINSQPEELIVLNEYDELGQLINKKVGGDVATIIENSLGLQTVDYTYNIRGWLKNINQDIYSDNDLFDFTINYNTISHGGTKLYNGNISETQWKTQSDNNQRWYTYQYDALNRITSGNDNTTDDRYSLENITYDKNGNIAKLKRNGHRNATFTSFGIMDDLTYSYDSNGNSNKLIKVADAASIDQFGFKDDAVNTTADTTDDYSYDDNGNMITDTNKGITSITYNHLNLPTIIKFGVSDSIEYIYDATGVKQRKKVTEYPNTTTTDYAGNYVYESDYLQFFNTPEGYVMPNDETDYDQKFSYVYQYKDHLGSIRLYYTDINQNIGAIDLEIVEENNYYPFGLEHKGYNNVINGTENNYKTFQGQEINKELGLNWLSFKYRNYDPAIGRFFNVDPLTEDYMDWGPYVFSGNRVIDARELEGLEPYVVTGRSFIPDKTISNPNPLSKTKSFAGDDRKNYQLNTTAYRTEQKVRVDFDNNEATTLNNRANSTTGYDKNGNVTDTSDPGKAGPTPTYTMDGNTATVNMEVDASNKLVDGAPAINYDVGVTITQNKDGSFSFELKGKSDGFPAYEFFITNEKDGKSYQIYGSNPNKTGDSAWSLFPPMEKKINESGSSTTTKTVEEEKQ